MSGAISLRSFVTNQVLIHVDYSESYGNKQQREIQSAYFCHTLFSIITLCCCLGASENKMIFESLTISSELSDHTRAATITSVLTVIDHLREKHQHVSLKKISIVSSDGCSEQFRSQFIFNLMSSIDSSLDITCCYNERDDGK